jgi:N-acetylglucosamine-6-phosphate deacetylase
MKSLPTYNYPKLINQLSQITPINHQHELAIEQILYGLENDHRFHWINDALADDGLPSIETILNYYEITTHNSPLN